MELKNTLFYSGMITALLFTSCKKDDDNNDDGTTKSCDIKISSADAPKNGSSYIITEADKNGVDVDSLISISGDGQNWDFSGLTSSNSKDSILIQAASLGSSAADHPNADHVISDGDVSSELYLATEANGFNIVGANFEFEGEMKITNAHTIIPYTLKYGESIKDDFVIEAGIDTTIDTTIFGQTFNNVPVEIEITQTNFNDFTVDGCGTITTPKGTFDCLRYVVEPGDATFEGKLTGEISGMPVEYPITNAEIEEYGAGESFNIYENKTYVWISKDSEYPLLQIEVDESEAVLSIRYQE